MRSACITTTMLLERQKKSDFFPYLRVFGIDILAFSTIIVMWPEGLTQPTVALLVCGSDKEMTSCHQFFPLVLSQ